MKDFYDLFYFVTYKWSDVNKKLLCEAIQTTFEHRGTKNLLDNFDMIIGLIENDESMYIRWETYQNRFFYARHINFKDIIEAIRKLKVYIFND